MLVCDLCSTHDIDALVILEPRISGNTTYRVINKLGFDHHVWVELSCVYSLIIMFGPVLVRDDVVRRMH